MASHLCNARPLLLFLTLLLTLLPMLKSVLVTEEEAALLAKGTQGIFCFSRTFEDLTCFWDEPAQVNQAYRFFYTYKGGQSHECALISVKQTEGGTRHICVFPSEHPGIQLFRELCVKVLNITSHRIILSQNFSVDTVGLIAPPMNVKVKWPGLARQLHVTWVPPPIIYTDFLAYQILYHVEGAAERPFRIEMRNVHAHYLRDLLPGKLYHIQLRTKPDGISLDGSWGTWSPVVLAKTPHLPEQIGLHCFTPDLKELRCLWDWNLMEPGILHSILYWAKDNSSSSRVQGWRKCGEKEERTKLHHYDHQRQACAFQPGQSGYISILVIVKQGEEEEDSYFKEPFELHHVVLTTPPKILEATPVRGMLKLDWAPPLEEIAEHMIYQIQYALQDTMKWKILQVEYANNSEIHVASGGCYCLQLRAQPDGQKFKGNWSAWSESLCLEVPPGAGSTLSNVAILLLCAGVALGLGCIPLSIYSNMKRKLWPPVPDPHHALDGFFEDNSKQQQQVNAFFYNKSLDDIPLTYLFEILPEVPLETAVYDSLLKETECDNQLPSYQHYMVLGCNSLQENHCENAYLEGTDDGHDTLSLSMEHDLHITLETKVQLSPFSLFSAPLSAPETKEGNWETSGDQSTSPMHISNQSYLLRGLIVHIHGEE